MSGPAFSRGDKVVVRSVDGMVCGAAPFAAHMLDGTEAVVSGVVDVGPFSGYVRLEPNGRSLTLFRDLAKADGRVPEVLMHPDCLSRKRERFMLEVTDHSANVVDTSLPENNMLFAAALDANAYAVDMARDVAALLNERYSPY